MVLNCASSFVAILDIVENCSHCRGRNDCRVPKNLWHWNWILVADCLLKPWNPLPPNISYVPWTDGMIALEEITILYWCRNLLSFCEIYFFEFSNWKLRDTPPFVMLHGIALAISLALWIQCTTEPCKNIFACCTIYLIANIIESEFIKAVSN